jgi:hypothetical protein
MAPPPSQSRTLHSLLLPSPSPDISTTTVRIRDSTTGTERRKGEHSPGPAVRLAVNPGLRPLSPDVEVVSSSTRARAKPREIRSMYVRDVCTPFNSSALPSTSVKERKSVSSCIPPSASYTHPPSMASEPSTGALSRLHVLFPFLDRTPDKPLPVIELEASSAGDIETGAMLSPPVIIHSSDSPPLALHDKYVIVYDFAQIGAYQRYLALLLSPSNTSVQTMTRLRRSSRSSWTISSRPACRPR